MTYHRVWSLVLLAVLFGAAAAPASSNSASPAVVSAYEVLGSYPHDPEAFLQGLVWHDGGFYEST
ncbi:MAG: glutaminyl-peptide cyclotransferase, partial [Chloroflexi bacterium]|nr:glutaminyl-peptide cyclotransferase [Chloroflexota bacterium]